MCISFCENHGVQTTGKHKIMAKPWHKYYESYVNPVTLPCMSSLKVQYLSLYAANSRNALWLPKSSN